MITVTVGPELAGDDTLENGSDSLQVGTITSLLAFATGWSSFPSLTSWPVRRIAFTLDVNVGMENMRPTLHALAAIRRAHSAASLEWRDRSGRLTGIRFGREDYRAVFYDKEAEIRNRIAQLLRRQDPFPRGRVAEREQLAEQAAGVIRFEVLLRGAEEVQAVYKLPARMLPALRLMLMPGVGEYVLGEELRRLRLDLLGEPRADEHVEHGVRGLFTELVSHAKSFNENTGDAKNSRRDELSLVRTLAMLGYYVLASEMNRDEVSRAWGGGGSSIFDLERDLRAIGMPNSGHMSREPLYRLQFFMDVLRGHMPNVPEAPPPLPLHAYDMGLVTEAPWVGQVSELDDINGLSVEDVVREADQGE